MIMNKICME